MPTPNISRMTPISASCCASPLIGDEAGGERPDGDARQEVAHQRRQAEPGGHQAEHEREAQARGDRADECGVVRHRMLRMGSNAARR